MKTTENISLAGYAFTIETDAYETLSRYLAEIRKGFEGDPSADEIVSDIEERIAELLSERCPAGMVVNVSMIEDIRKRIGDPEVLAQTESDNAGTPAPEPKEEKKTSRSKRLYRNMEERIFGGVCSGLGSYFGIDKVIFRLIFLIVFFIGFMDEGGLCGIATIAYICLWIAMPAARTVEQKCEMRGKPMNLDGFRSKDFNLEKEVKDASQSPAGQTFKRAGGVFLGLILLCCGLSGLLGCIFIPTLPTIIGHEITEEIMELGMLDAQEQFLTDMVCGTQFWGLVLMVTGLACIGMIYGGIMLLFDLKAPSWRPGLVLFIAWIISLFILIGWVVKSVAEALPTLVNIF